MLRRTFVSFVAGIVACISSHVLAQPVEGTYDLDFMFNDPVLRVLAHIEADGEPAAGGVVVFQYCSFNGFPTNDITQPDEAPSRACDVDKTATWTTLVRMPVNVFGEALLNFGPVLVVNEIGFRYRYIGQGSGIRNKLVDGEDWMRFPLP